MKIKVLERHTWMSYYGPALQSFAVYNKFGEFQEAKIAVFHYIYLFLFNKHLYMTNWVQGTTLIAL